VGVKININPSMTHMTEGQEVLEVEGTTVGECLQQLVARFPDTRNWIFGKDGKLNDVLDIYVNLESSYPEELAMKVRDGDEIHIISQVAGG
jgi:molybdopterin converting factor small subunit